MRKIIIGYKKYIFVLAAGLIFSFFLPQIHFASASVIIGGKILSPFKISVKTMIKLGLAPELMGLQKYYVQDEKKGKIIVFINGITFGKCIPGKKIGSEAYKYKGFYITKGGIGKTACGK